MTVAFTRLGGSEGILQKLIPGARSHWYRHLSLRRFEPHSYRNAFPLRGRTRVRQHPAQNRQNRVISLAEIQLDDMFAGQHQGGAKFGVRLLKIGHRVLVAGQRKVLSFSEYPGARS
jgi:hypothetical protein